jgi:hypothetical protein
VLENSPYLIGDPGITEAYCDHAQSLAGDRYTCGIPNDIAAASAADREASATWTGLNPIG